MLHRFRHAVHSSAPVLRSGDCRRLRYCCCPRCGLRDRKTRCRTGCTAAMAAAHVTGISGRHARAVVLLDDTTFVVGADGKAVEHRRRVVKILRPNGRDEGNRLCALRCGFEAAFATRVERGAGRPGVCRSRTRTSSGVWRAQLRSALQRSERYKVAQPPGRDPGGVIAYEYEQRTGFRTDHEADWFFQDDIPQPAPEPDTLELPPGFTLMLPSWAHHKTEPAIDLEHQRTRWELASVPGDRPGTCTAWRLR